MSQEPDHTAMVTMRLMARKWLNAELEFYEAMTSGKDNPRYSPWIPKKRKRKPQQGPPIRHLVHAANEFARRFPFRSTEKEVEMNDEPESPFLLVATKVRDNWEVPDNFQNDHSVRFMLMPGEIKNDSILFIKCMAGPEHGSLDGYITADVNAWIRVRGLDTIFSRVAAGGIWYAPDEAYQAEFHDQRHPNLDADPNLKGLPFARLVMEVEYAHRSAMALRELGFIALDNPYTRLFLAVKVWKKCPNGNFAAAAVLWGKDDDGVVSVRQAVDFGTKAMENQSKAKFQEVGHESMLPPVVEWTRPDPTPDHADLRAELEFSTSRTMLKVPVNETTNKKWGMFLPAADLLFKMSTDESTDETPYYLDANEAIPDCVMNLLLFAWKVNKKNWQ